MPIARSTRPVSESSGHNRSGDESRTRVALKLRVKDDMTGTPSTRKRTLLVALYTAILTKHSMLDYKTNAAKRFSVLRRGVAELELRCYSCRGNSPICR